MTHNIDSMHLHGVIVAVDDDVTQITEDAFRFSTDQLTGERKLEIFTIVPVNPTIIQENVPYHLRDLAERINGKNERGRMTDFMTKESKKNNSLSEQVERRVMYASFSLIRSSQETYILEESFGYAQITVKYLTHNQFIRDFDIDGLAKFIDDLFEKYEKTEARAFGTYNITKELNGIGPWMIRIINGLFNQACVEECKRNKVPYFYMKRNGEVTSGSDDAFFNKPLRDVLAFVNSMNLYNFLTMGKILYSEEEVIDGLPRRFKT